VGESVIIRGEIPENAKLVEYIDKDVPYNDIFYGYDEEFSSFKVNGPWFFEKRSLDEIRFSIRFEPMDVFGTKIKALIFVRGIDYTELPMVHDYQTKVTIKAEEMGLFNWYEPKFYLTERAPWTVITRYIKNDPAYAVELSLFAAALIGLVSAFIVTLIQKQADTMHKTESNKEDNSK
jgi:hypothetical protein